MRAEPPYGHGRATVRATRALLVTSTSTLGLYTVIYGADVVAQSHQLWAPYAVAMVVLGIVMPLTYLAATFVFPFARVLAVARVAAIAFIAAEFVWPLMQEPAVLDSSVTPWPHLFAPFTLMVAAAAIRPRAIVPVAAAQAAAAIPLILAAREHATELVVVEIVGAWGPALLFTAFVFGLLSHAQRVDVAAEQARAASLAAVEEQAIADEAAAVNARIHDDVLAVLASLHRDPVGTPAADVGAALDSIAALDAQSEPASVVQAPQSFIAELFTEAEGILPQVELNASGARTEPLPTDVARMVKDVMREALRNVAKHVGPQASASLSVLLHDDRLHVVLIDRGQGFDLKSVGPDRLGVSTSILARARLVPGAHATVESSKGRGTVVEVAWADPR